MDINMTRDNLFSSRRHHVSVQGTGAADPTLDAFMVAKRITVKRTGVGTYAVAWLGTPGNFCQPRAPAFRSATMVDVKLYSATFSLWTPTTKTISFTVFNSAGAATDLAAGQFIDLEFVFQETTGTTPL